jgi:ATP-dependent Clp protease ATP-binding subunit ClpC
MGARPLRRAIQRYIEDPLADFVLRAELMPGGTVMVDKAPEDRDPETPEVTLRVVAPKKAPKPVGVGAAGGDDATDEPVEDKILPGEPDASRSENPEVE